MSIRLSSTTTGREAVPEFYERDARGSPPRWLRRVRASLRSIGLRFCAGRILDDYLAGPYRDRPVE